MIVSRRLALAIALVIVLAATIAATISGLIVYRIVDNRTPETSDLIAGCNQASESRVAQFHLYDHLVAANHRRVQSASSKAEAMADRRNLRRYRKDRREFVEAQRPGAIAPGELRPDGVRTDCEARYR